jgi:AhpD family alkylhydroperoxidase
MKNLTIPTREQVSPANQIIFDNLKKGLGFVPNLYATFANSDTALGNYVTFQTAKSSLRAKEKEVINLVVSQVNDCHYCLSAHTVLGKMNGFTDEQIIDLRKGTAPFDAKLDALVKLAKAITLTHGKPDGTLLDNFFAAGYTEGNLVDVILVVGDKIISNYLNNIANTPIDFPIAEPLETAEV